MAERVAVAMSGGVDSSVAAGLLRDAGWEVIGLAMHLWDGEAAGGGGRRCCGERDLQDARTVAARLGIPCYVLDYQETFHREILKPFARDYLAGNTPSPCILCNSEVKFKHLQGLARRLGAAYLATGHYARVIRGPGRGRIGLWKGTDSRKDQSYFLFNLRQEQLDRLFLPLGERTKESVRELARRWDLPVAEKEESQDLCFVSSGGYRRVIDRVAPEGCRRPGEIVDTGGRVVGHHDGIEGFTVGQRRGLGVASAVPRYVVAIEKDRNRVVIGPRREVERDRLVAERVNWIAFEEPPEVIDAVVRIRSHHPGAPARIRPASGGRARVDFLMPQAAIAPGQAAVFYRGEEVLGGGWIIPNG